MRKLFSILAVAMTAISLNATVVTQEYDLADLIKQQESATWSANELTVTKGWDGIAHDYGEYPYNAEDYTELTLELASPSEVDVNLAIQYSSDNSKSDKTIEAGSLIARIPLSSSSIKRIDIKLTAAGSATISKLYFSKVIGKKNETNLFTDSRTFNNWEWDNRIVFAPSVFNAVHEGDELVVTYTTGATGQCALRIQDLEEGSNYLNEAGQFADVAINQSTSDDFTVVLRESDITALKAHGLYINGQDMTVSRVKLVTYAAQMMVETQLASGATVLNWNEVYNTTSFPTLSEGDELHVVLSDIDDSNNYQVIFRNGWEETNLITTITGIASSDVLPKAYSVTLTAAQAAAFNDASRIFVTGTGVTIARFSIAQPMSIYDESILWSGEQAVTNDWSGNVTIAKEALADIKEGNIICVQLSAVGGDDADDQVLLKYGDSWTDFSPAANYLFQANSAVAPMTVEIPVTAKMRDQLRGNKLVVTGRDFTMTHVFIKEGTPVNTNSHFVTVTEAGMATLVLPFDVPSLPSGVQAYNLTNNGDATIWAEEVGSLTADKPVLIIAAEGEYKFVSEAGASDDIASKTGTLTNGALIGTYTSINPLAQTTGGNYNYVLNNQGGNVAFYQVLDEPCSVAPYRAYLSCAHNANAGGANPAPRMRIVFRENTTTGVENTESAKPDGARKLLRNGQLYIIRNGVEYNANGQMTK